VIKFAPLKCLYFTSSKRFNIVHKMCLIISVTVCTDKCFRTLHFKICNFFKSNLKLFKENKCMSIIARIVLQTIWRTKLAYDLYTGMCFLYPAQQSCKGCKLESVRLSDFPSPPNNSIFPLVHNLHIWYIDWSWLMTPINFEVTRSKVNVIGALTTKRLPAQ
jgi:hypothetical protein